VPKSDRPSAPREQNPTQAPTPPFATHARRERLTWIAGFTLGALLLGLFRLAHKGMWLDEAASASFALAAPHTWFADHNMALYYALLGAWVRLFEHGEFALRSLSVLCFVASVPPFYMLAEALFSERIARIATALYVSNALLVHFAQEARGYMLAVLLVIVSNLALVRILKRREWGWVAGYGVSMGLALYAHLFAAWVSVAHACVLLPLCFAPRAVPRAQLFIAYGLAAAIAAPLCLQAFSAGADQVSWLYPPSVQRTWGTVVMLSGGSPLLALGETVLFALFTLPLLRDQDSADALARRLVLAWLLVPIVASLAFSLFVAPIAHPKYLIVSLPAWLLGAAAAVDRLSWAKLRAAALSALLLSSTYRLQVWYGAYEKERWSEVVALIATQQRAGDAIVLDLLGSEAFHYYVERLGLEQQLPAPLFSAGWGFPVPLVRGLDSVPKDRKLAAAATRIWRVRNRSDSSEAAQLDSHHLLWTRRFEPFDEDASSLFADSSGRIITLQLFAPNLGHIP
jgi:4-amino-4-deoxy-L-arabinose transferase-like glycosyltransferase